MAGTQKLSPPELVDQFESYTLLEISEFVKLFEDKFGVTAAAPVAAVAAAPTGAEAAAEEQTEFTVMLTGAGANKIAVIKAVRELTQLSQLTDGFDHRNLVGPRSGEHDGELGLLLGGGLGAGGRGGDGGNRSSGGYAEFILEELDELRDLQQRVALELINELGW